MLKIIKNLWLANLGLISKWRFELSITIYKKSIRKLEQFDFINYNWK